MLSKSKSIHYYGFLDYFKLFCAILVIAIHTYPLASFDKTANYIFTGIISRIGVPFFFMVTGFFLLPKFCDPTKNAISTLVHFIKKTGILYLFTILLYLPINLYSGYFKQENLTKNILKDILIDGTFYHLWYLPAVITGVLLTAFLLKFLGKLGCGILCILLYIIALFGDSYYGLTTSFPFITSFYEHLFSWMDYTRNGIFFAPIFLFLGYFIYEINTKSTKLALFSLKINTLFFILSFFLLLVEGLVLYHFSLQRHDSMYIMLLPAMFFLFEIWIISSNTYGIPSNKMIRTISMILYVIHPYTIIILRGIAKVLKLEAILIQNSLIHFVMVTILSIIASYFILQVTNLIADRRKE